MKRASTLSQSRPAPSPRSDLWIATMAMAMTAALLPFAAAESAADSATDEAFPRTLTIGVFTFDGEDYHRIEGRDLVFEHGDPCFVWARETQGCTEVEGKHLHYNAANEMSYVDRSFSWVEYGPEHSEEEIVARCDEGRDPTEPKKVDWTHFFEERHGERDPYYLQIVRESCPEIEHVCYEIPSEYDGAYAVPEATMMLRPSAEGDTVLSSADYPPGEGEQVVVGYWEHVDGIDHTQENPCAGEPTMKISYPLEYSGGRCFPWEHWVHGKEGSGEKFDLHPNSARNFQCENDGSFSFSQWTTMSCTLDEPTANCADKQVSRTFCCRDNPPWIWSKILVGCGKAAPGAR